MQYFLKAILNEKSAQSSKQSIIMANPSKFTEVMWFLLSNQK